MRTRFRREAELLASLNHPNIAVIHDIIEPDDRSGYLVLEYVPGETLAERMKRGSLTMNEVLSISQQIAEAISVAHRKGIVHRDLKPGNIKITLEDQVKVLDFGLAKSFVKKQARSEITQTQHGRVIGTPAYMSPEQARGNETDHRTDVWSFGCIMYQMLTAHLPFEGETATDTLARIIEREPDWERLPKNTPTEIRTLLRYCLEKDPNQRLENIANAGIEIGNMLTKPVTSLVETIPKRSRRTTMVMATIGVIVLIGAAMWFGLNKVTESSTKVPRLVVLPFENLGRTEDAYFADAITDEIRTRLISLHELDVISRYSAMQYKNGDKNVRQIGSELRVDHILAGTIRRKQQSNPNRLVRMTLQLVKTSDDTIVWSKTYDIDLPKIFQAQSDVAEQVAQALSLALPIPQRQPTENAEAYDCYRRGEEYSSRGHHHIDDLETAIGRYERAVNLDEKFALAWAKLSQAYAAMYWFHGFNNEHLAVAEASARKALDLEPDLPEAHWALGYCLYWGHYSYNLALKEFEIALSSQPSNTQIIAAIGYVQRQQGNFPQALKNIRRAYDLDPLSHEFATELGLTYLLMREYQNANDYCDRAIDLAPDQPKAYEWKACICLRWQGDMRGARKILEEALQKIKLKDNTGDIAYRLVNIDIYEKKYQDVLDRLASESNGVENMSLLDVLRYALVCRYMGKTEVAEKCFTRARSALKAQVIEKPEEAYLHSFLGIACAGLGLTEEALKEGQRGIDLLPMATERRRGIYRLEDFARINVMVGRYDEAVDQIKRLLAVPGRLSIPLLRLDPAWDDLRNNHRFKKLLESDK